MPDLPGRPSPGEAKENAATSAHAPVAHEPEEHGHGSAELGPPDVAAWAAGFLGVLLGLAAVLVLYLSAHGV